MFTDLFNINGGDYFGSMEEHFEGGDYSRGTRRGGDFGYDPNYYHSWFDIRKVLNRTDKAVQVEALIGLAFWVPKKLIRGEKPGKILVHQQTYISLMRSAAEEIRNCLDALPNLDTGEDPHLGTACHVRNDNFCDCCHSYYDENDDCNCPPF